MKLDNLYKTKTTMQGQLAETYNKSFLVFSVEINRFVHMLTVKTCGCVVFDKEGAQISGQRFIML